MPSMHGNNSGGDAAMLGLLAIAIPVLAVAFYVKNATGASFTSVFHAVIWSFVVLAAAGAIIYLASTSSGESYALPILGVLPAILWPIWWPVINSVACNGCNPGDRGDLDFVTPWESFWWDTWYTKIGVELVFLALLAFLATRWMNDPYR